MSNIQEFRKQIHIQKFNKQYKIKNKKYNIKDLKYIKF